VEAVGGAVVDEMFMSSGMAARNEAVTIPFQVASVPSGAARQGACPRPSHARLPFTLVFLKEGPGRLCVVYLRRAPSLS